MYVDSEYILDRLLEGEKIEDIAQEMSDELNKAKTAYAEIQKKREEEEKLQEEKKLKEKAAYEAEAEAVYEAKEEAVERILDALCDYYAADKNDDMLKLIHKFEVGNMIEALDELGELFHKLGKLEELEFKFPWF